MTDKPTDAEIVALMRDGNNCNYNDECEHIDFARAVLTKWGTQPQAGEVPQRWKAVPVNPTPEMWKAAKSVPDPNPPYPPHYGLVWDAMLAATPTPPAEQQAPKETLGGVNGWRDISTAPKDGSRFVATGHNYGLYSEIRHTCVAQWFRGCWMEASDWNETSELKYLTHWMPLPSPPDDVAAPAEQQAAPKAAPVEGNSGFDHKTAADFLNGKTVSDEAVRKFVAASRWAHDERAALSATLLAMHGVLTSREAEIAPLKKALLEAEAAPQQEAKEPVMIYHGRCTIDCGEHGHHDVEMLRMIPAGSKLYTAPQPVAREPLTDTQIAEMMRDTWGCASIAPRHALEFARTVERAHGIAQKGGSNADT